MVWIALVAAVQAAPVYFPPRYARPQVHCPTEGKALPIVNDFVRGWYGEQLAAAREPSLYIAALRANADSLRFAWIPSFDPTVTVRIEGLTSAAPRLIARRLDGAGGTAPGKVVGRIDRALTAAEAADLRRRLAAANPLAMVPVECGGGGLDGSRWLIERAIGNRYRLIDRWSPENGPVRAAGMAMLRLTGWRFEAVY